MLVTRSRFKRVVFVWLLILISTSGWSCGKAGDNAGIAEQSVLQKVLKSGEIRCGYVVYPPGSIKDPNTGELSGICVETLEQAAENLGLKVNWVEEVGWGTMIEGLATDRYDLIGSPVWPNASRALKADFTVALFYSGIGAFVRSDDPRFSNTVNESQLLSQIDNAEYKIATVDGEMSDIIARAQFPKAQRVSLTQMTDVSQVLLEVSQRKADVAFVEPFYGHEFLKNNPGTVKNIAANQPIRVFPNVLMLKKGETGFARTLNTALDELNNQGFTEQLVRKYETAPGLLYRVAYPYRIVE